MRKKPTKADISRFQAIQHIGCIACRQDGVIGIPSDIHHLVNGYRIGHHATIPLCPWHHRGVPEGVAWTRGMPSIATNKKAFIAKYGTELELLEEVNRLIK